MATKDRPAQTEMRRNSLLQDRLITFLADCHSLAFPESEASDDSRRGSSSIPSSGSSLLLGGAMVGGVCMLGNKSPEGNRNRQEMAVRFPITRATRGNAPTTLADNGCTIPAYKSRLTHDQNQNPPNSGKVGHITEPISSNNFRRLRSQ